MAHIYLAVILFISRATSNVHATSPYPKEGAEYVFHCPKSEIQEVTKGDQPTFTKEVGDVGRSFCFKVFVESTDGKCAGQTVTVHYKDDKTILKDPSNGSELPSGESCNTPAAAMLKMGCGVSFVGTWLVIDDDVLTYGLENGYCLSAKFTYDESTGKSIETPVGEKKKCPP